ncbi:MAG TPA: FAD-binding oxidoreductase [Gemmatimonadales bacterium]|nr:FAD-binding oxidoreductase [Gemmatimonadales bacterium]
MSAATEPAPVPLTADTDVRRAFARDASGLELVPECVARPESAAEVVELLRRAARERTPVTPAGGQSSTTGASITDRGMLLSLRGLARVRDLDVAQRTVRVEPGVGVAALRRVAAEHGLLFAPDPTSEEEATIGGALACNASGARSLRYGPIRAHVRALTVALAGGEVLELRRPGLEKNTVGYAAVQDPVDWFVGSEGTLGVILEAELALLPLPARVTGVVLPFSVEADALAFVAAARESTAVRPRCLEYFDAGALALVHATPGGEAWGADAAALVYAEEASDAGEASEPDEADAGALDAWLALAERHAARVDDAAVLETEGALREARRLRHAVPAAMNERGARCRAAGGRKVSTDWAVPYRRLPEAIAAARAAAGRAGVEPPVIYGHAGNGHPHENFLARDADELAAVERAVEETLRAVVALGGTVAAEHGIGKLKRRWLPLQLSGHQLGAMRALKRELDPLGLLAPGNVL